MSLEPAGYPTRLPKVLLCGGGTGGHVYPALAVAAVLRERAGVSADHGPAAADTRWSAVYVGSEDGMEAGLVANESDLPFRPIPAAALRGRSPLMLVRNVGILASGVRAARRLIAQEQPLAILGTGGYVCVPLFLAARLANVPTAIYLPDVVPGLAVRLLARLSTVVACNVADSARYFGLQAIRPNIQNPTPKLVITGYPVRRELFEQDRAICRAAFGLDAQLPVLFVYGGSRGARSINQAIAALLPHLLPIAQIVHVCGREGDEHWLSTIVEQLPNELQARYKLYPYLFSGNLRSENEKLSQSDTQLPLSILPAHASLPTMLQAFGAADLAVCRSGASTLGELPAAALPAVLVPYPFVHQDENADYLVRHGAAHKLRDSDMLGDGAPESGPLFRLLRQLIENTHERATMSERSQALAQPDAAERLANLLIALATRKRSTL